MAGGPWHRALDTFLHRLWTRAATTLFRLFPARQDGWLDETAKSAIAGPAHRQICATRRERMATQAHAMDKILPRPVGDDAGNQKIFGCHAIEISCNEPRLDLPHATSRQGDGDHRTIGGKAVCFVLDLRCRLLCRAA